MESKLLNKKKTKFSVADAALASLLFVIYNFLFVQIYLGIFPNGAPENSFAMFALQFLLEAVFLVASITVALSKKISFSATGIKKHFNAKMVLLGLCISLVCLFGFGSITTVFLNNRPLFSYTCNNPRIIAVFNYNLLAIFGICDCKLCGSSTF